MRETPIGTTKCTHTHTLKNLIIIWHWQWCSACSHDMMACCRPWSQRRRRPRKPWRTWPLWPASTKPGKLTGRWAFYLHALLSLSLHEGKGLIIALFCWVQFSSRSHLSAWETHTFSTSIIALFSWAQFSSRSHVSTWGNLYVLHIVKSSPLFSSESV